MDVSSWWISWDCDSIYVLKLYVQREVTKHCSIWPRGRGAGFRLVKVA